MFPRVFPVKVKLLSEYGAILGLWRDDLADL